MVVGKPTIGPNDVTDKASQLRRDIISMAYNAKSGHLGGSLSIVEMLVAVYYFIMRFDPGNPSWEERDRFILSKGHCAPALYVVLADLGFFPKDMLLTSFRRVGGKLQGHVDMCKTPGVDMTAGSLGIGLSVGCGMAFGARLKKLPTRVFVLLGDGECGEGQVWEAADTAARFGLDNLTALVDVNGLQNDGRTPDTLCGDALLAKWRSFGWTAVPVNGNCVTEVVSAYNSLPADSGKPAVLLCATTKGKGVSFMENNNDYHGYKLDEAGYRRAMAELADKSRE